MHLGFRKAVKSWLGPSPTPSVNGDLQPSPTPSRRTSRTSMRAAAPYPGNAAPTHRHSSSSGQSYPPHRPAPITTHNRMDSEMTDVTMSDVSSPGTDSLTVPALNYPAGDPGAHTPTYPRFRSPSIYATPIPENEQRALSSLGTQCALSLAQVTAELMPVPCIGPLVGSLTWVFQAVERARVNKEQWKLLQGRCVMVMRIAGAQVTNYGQQHYPGLQNAAQMLDDTLKRITSRAQHYNSLNEIVALVHYQVISDEIRMLFDELDSCLGLFSYATDVAQGQWLGEFQAVQAQELAELERVRDLLSSMDANLEGISKAQEQLVGLPGVTASDVSTPEMGGPAASINYPSGEPVSRASAHSHSLSPSRYASPIPENEQLTLTPLNGNERTNLAMVETPPLAGMSSQEMFECLTRHGCSDLTEHVDMEAISPMAMATGACGDIWKGKLCDGTVVAIKVWRFRWVDEKPHKSLKGAMREIYNWAKLDHDNIHKLLGVFVLDGKLAMVSKWMENGNLREFIRLDGTADLHQLCIQVTKAVQYLHSQNMVHGDLKACNFLVSPDGIAQLTDFDRSIVSDRSLVFSQTTSLGGGTARWMAPELMEAPDPDHNVDPRSKQADVYALAMTLLEIITGDVPYSQCSDIMAVMRYKMGGRTPERTDHFRTARGDRIWQLLVECWDYDPAARPTAQQVLNLLLAADEIQTVSPGVGN